MVENYVLLPCYEGGVLTKRVLTEIRKAGIPYRLLMIEDVGIPRCGLSRAKNILIDWAFQDPECKYLVVLSNDDFAFPDNWLKLLVDEMDFDPKIGAVAAGIMVDLGKGWGNYSPDGKLRWLPEDDPEWLCTFCDFPEFSPLTILRAEAVKAIPDTWGWFDELYGMGGYESLDMAMRLWQAGFKVKYSGKVPFRHDVAGGNTYTLGKDYDFNQNGRHFASKWGSTDVWNALRDKWGTK